MSPVEYATFWVTVFVYMLGAGLALTGRGLPPATSGQPPQCIACGARAAGPLPSPSGRGSPTPATSRWRAATRTS